MPNPDPRIHAALTVMSAARANWLDTTPHGRLLLREMREGWHFCPEFDYMVTPGEQLDRKGRCAFCGFDKRQVLGGRRVWEVVAQKFVNLLATRAGVG